MTISRGSTSSGIGASATPEIEVGGGRTLHAVGDSALHTHDPARGVRLIAGVDEVRRACWAGPIMAAGVLFDLERLTSGEGRLLEELDDSKRLARAKRERLAKAVLAHAEAVSLVSIPAREIDRIGLQAANRPRAGDASSAGS